MQRSKYLNILVIIYILNLLGNNFKNFKFKKMCVRKAQLTINFEIIQRVYYGKK